MNSFSDKNVPHTTKPRAWLETLREASKLLRASSSRIPALMSIPQIKFLSNSAMRPLAHAQRRYAGISRAFLLADELASVAPASYDPPRGAVTDQAQSKARGATAGEAISSQAARKSHALAGSVALVASTDLSKVLGTTGRNGFLTISSRACFVLPQTYDIKGSH